MGYGIRMEAWGDYALFSRPEMSVERVSYDVITPSAARGLLEAVYWHPGLKWRVDRIHVLNPIRFSNVRRNEVSSKLLASTVSAAMAGTGTMPVLDRGKDIQQRASLLLRDVRYVIEAHFDMTPQAGMDDTPDKFYAIALNRLRAGKCFHQPYFGCREFPAHFRRYEEDETPIADALRGERDLGYMLYDMDYDHPGRIQPMFFRCVMRDGTIDLRDCEVIR